VRPRSLAPVESRARAKDFLSQAGIDVTERDVDKDPAAYDELIARGWRTVPMTVIGNRVIRRFDPVALQVALAQA
jgi:glutaredoxin